MVNEKQCEQVINLECTTVDDTVCEVVQNKKCKQVNNRSMASFLSSAMAVDMVGMVRERFRKLVVIDFVR